MNLTIHSSFPASHRRYNDSPNSNRRDGGLGAARRRTWRGETAVAKYRDGGLKSPRQPSRIIETAKPSGRDRRPATRRPPSGGVGFSGLAAFVRSEQRKTTGGAGL
ncbi:hypothetical protein [Tannerella forsythia]|uniref:hypothetical protein n=1 Tax=Tannerella forsythia TaxID=28112 RepID=UPI0028E2F9C6|nr:hypothetical protein [Tannerella forsythia]